MENWKTKDYGQNGLTAILAAVVCNFWKLNIVIDLLSSLFAFIGTILIIIWVYRKATRKP